MSIPGDLDRARRLAFAADEVAARDLLLSLIPRIEQADRDDQMLEVLAQLGDIYLTRGANDGVRESIRRIDDCLAIYSAILAGTMPEAAAQVRMSDTEIAQMIRRYSRRARYLQTGLAAGAGDHEGAAAALAALADEEAFPELAAEHAFLLALARVLSATALCEDDLHIRSLPLWTKAIESTEHPAIDGDAADHLLVTVGTGYGRFCTETGNLTEAEPWLRRADARARHQGWELASARAQLELAVASWSAGDRWTTERLASAAYPVIARHARADDVSRCWLYLGLTRMAVGALEAADECWEHADRHWRELGRPLQIHRILRQRSWISIFRGDFAAAVELIAEARELLDASPRSSWLQYARLDNHLGVVWRADALAELGFDGAGDPTETLRETEARQAKSLGVTHAQPGSPQSRRAAAKFEQAAELMVPAALAVDSVRYSIADADARSRWATNVAAPILAGAFAVAWESDNTQLVSELIEYHSARGTFSAEPEQRELAEWATTAAPVFLDAEDALAAGTPRAGAGGGLTRLGPLPPLRMQPDSPPILAHYRELAVQRYGRAVTAAEPAWSTWP